MQACAVSFLFFCVQTGAVNRNLPDKSRLLPVAAKAGLHPAALFYRESEAHL